MSVVEFYKTGSSSKMSGAEASGSNFLSRGFNSVTSKVQTSYSNTKQSAKDYVKDQRQSANNYVDSQKKSAENYYDNKRKSAEKYADDKNKALSSSMNRKKEQAKAAASSAANRVTSPFKEGFGKVKGWFGGGDSTDEEAEAQKKE
jgi:hypothetical protein